MGRPPDHFNPFRIKPRPAKGCAYASTRSSFIDPETGKRTTRRIRWGGLEDGERFIPDERLATPEELSQLIFPDGRDVREAVGFSGCGLGKAWPATTDAIIARMVRHLAVEPRKRESDKT